MMTTSDILEALYARNYAPYLTITGGDPCLHKGLGEIITPLNARNILIAVETQGQLFPEWLAACDVVTFSPKGPSSGNTVDIHDLVNWLKSQVHGNRRRLKVCIKVVIFNEEDFTYAMDVYRRIPHIFYDAFYFTAGTPMLADEVPPENGEELIDYINFKVNGVMTNQQAVAQQLLTESAVTNFNERVHLGCQQHVLLWPDKHKGV